VPQAPAGNPAMSTFVLLSSAVGALGGPLLVRNEPTGHGAAAANS
jgi:hypothetical protein